MCWASSMLLYDQDRGSYAVTSYLYAVPRTRFINFRREYLYK